MGRYEDSENDKPPTLDSYSDGSNIRLVSTREVHYHTVQSGPSHICKWTPRVSKSNVQTPVVHLRELYIWI